MDVTPMIPGNRWVINGYGPNQFRISGEVYHGSMLVFPTGVASWSVGAVEDLTAQNIVDAVSQSPEHLEILLLGSGGKMTLVPRTVRDAVIDRGISVDVMETGAACRTYNVLLAEGRSVGAALIAI
ncbi:Mth938-like domain-containing protein [Fodinicurvata sp. EGI_FJ10296]|uniref:Mth938-like domain-containing protein n=1 Tax=Fodinicurvata sp. EGI_FJ10296 TaxID=3231908 RepID=UPI003452AD98